MDDYFQQSPDKPWAFFPCLPPENAPAFALYAVSLTRSVAKTERSGDASPKPKHKKNTPKKTTAELPKNSLKPGQTSPGWKRYVENELSRTGTSKRPSKQLQVTIPLKPGGFFVGN